MILGIYITLIMLLPTHHFQLAFFIVLIVITSSFLIGGSHTKQIADINGLLKLGSIKRTIDGSNNNLEHPHWGKSFTNLRRISAPKYADGKGQPLTNLPNTRFLSEAVAKLQNNKVVPNEFNLTMLWGTWGQFLDHDITLSEQDHAEPQLIHIPRCDQYYDPQCTGTATLQYARSEYDPTQQIRTNLNQLTSWIDASMVYGSTKEVSDSLRTFQSGKLKTSTGDLMPIDQDGQYYAGDVRATENMGLATLQILFLREHNRLCDQILAANKTMPDQQIYNIARNYVIALIQKISFYDYLPNLFGKQHFDTLIGAYKGYDPKADPTIMTEFSSTSYRIGHPYVPHTYKAVNNNNYTVEKISLLQLFQCFPQKLTYLRVNTILKGLAFTLAKDRNLRYVDELRNIPPQLIGQSFDLFATNTERGRDHGIADYNTLRVAFGLKRLQKFQDIFQNELDSFILQKSYNSVDNIDSYVGILGEPKLPGSFFGELGAKIAGIQFSNIRNGDRFWFESAYPAEVVQQIKQTTLTNIIYRNTQIKNMPGNGFFCFDCTV